MNRTIKSGICDRIQDARKAANMSQVQLGDAIHLGQRSISKFENGEQLPSLEQLFDLADALKTDPVKLLFDVERDNFDIAMETGLSDDAISFLKKSQNKEGWRKSFENRAAAVINALISNRLLIDSLYGYLFSDFSELEYFNPYDLNAVHKVEMDDEKVTFFPEMQRVKASQIRSIGLESFEALYRVSLMDELSALRKSETITEKRKERINRMKVGSSVFKGFIKSKEIEMTDDDIESWKSLYFDKEDDREEE